MLENIEILMWIVATIAILYRIFSIKKNIRELLSPVTIVWVGFFFIYVIAYFVLPEESKEKFLSQEGYAKLLILAILSAVMFQLGFKKRYRFSKKVDKFDPIIIKFMASFFIILGILGFGITISLSGGLSTYYGNIHKTAGAWKTTSAYLYKLELFAFPGILLLIGCINRFRMSLISKAIMVSGFSFVFVDAWLSGRRGSWLRILIIFMVYFIFLRAKSRRPPKRLIIVMTVILLSVVVFTPYIRYATYLGSSETVIDAVKRVVKEKNPLAGSTIAQGNELFNAAALIQAADVKIAFDYGLGWVRPVTNFLPRGFFPDKDKIFVSSVDRWSLMLSVVGWEPGYGSALTGVADAFVRFYWFSPIVWVLFGVVGSYFYKRACKLQDLKSVGYLTSYLVGIVYMITQDFFPFVHSFLFFAGPIWISFFLAKHVSARRLVGR